MVYKNKDKQKEYLRNWRKTHKGYYKEYYQLNKNERKLINLKQKDKMKLKKLKYEIEFKKQISQNPMSYKDYWTEEEFYDID